MVLRGAARAGWLWRVRVHHHYSPGCPSLKKNDNWPVLKVFVRDTDFWRERNHFTRQRGYRSFTSKRIIFIFSVRWPITGRTVPQRQRCKQSKGSPHFNPYFYIPKYRSSDALPAFEFSFLSCNCKELEFFLCFLSRSCPVFGIKRPGMCKWARFCN